MLDSSDATILLEPSRVCIFCWHFHRQIHYDDETHACIRCPQHNLARAELFETLDDQTAAHFNALPSNSERLMFLLCSSAPATWAALGRFLFRIRQVRRRLRVTFSAYENRLQLYCFQTKRKAWRKEGKHVCRHGVFFRQRPVLSCPCLQEVPDWRNAFLMPCIDSDLHKLIAVKFDAGSLRRLASLQAELRRLNSN